MKKVIAGIMAASLFLSSVGYVEAKANANPYEEPIKIRCTCYTAPKGAITKSGQEVREGIIAGKKEWLGCVAILYDMDMNCIGFFEFLDTGAGIDTDGDGKGDSIKNGTSVDVYRDSMEGVRDWVNTYGDYCYMQIVKAVG